MRGVFARRGAGSHTWESLAVLTNKRGSQPVSSPSLHLTLRGRPSLRHAGTDTTKHEIPPPPPSQWPLTVAFSLLAFVIGIGIESGWRRPAKITSEDFISRKEWKQSLKDLQESLLGSFKSDNDDQKHFKEVGETGVERSDGSEKHDKVGENGDDNDDVPSLPELDLEDSKGWREFAESILNKLIQKRESIRDLEEKLSTTQADRDNIEEWGDAQRVDSQRNAELFTELLLSDECHGRLIIDDDILRVHPWGPDEDLFTAEARPTILRVLNDNGLTRCLILNIEGPTPSKNEDQSEKQWEYVSSWFQEIVEDIQQAGQVCPDDFWNIIWSQRWYKSSYPAYKLPESHDDVFNNEINRVRSKLKLTSEPGMDRYRIPSDPSNIRPHKGRLGTFTSHATLYPGENEAGKPRETHVLIDTGAQISCIDSEYIPKNAAMLRVPSVDVTGFGGGFQVLKYRVPLRMRLHGEDKTQGIDIQTTAYVVDKTSSGIGVELGMDVMRPMGVILDIPRGVLRVEQDDGKACEAPIIFFQKDDEIKGNSGEAVESSSSIADSQDK